MVFTSSPLGFVHAKASFMAEKVRNFGQKTVSKAASRGFRSLLLMRKTSCTIRDGQCRVNAGKLLLKR